MDPWDGAEQYPQDRVFQQSVHGDLNYYRKRLAEDEDLCLQECDDDLELLRDNPVIIIDIPKHESNPQRQTETSFANAENNELTKCLRNVSIE
jgi:hypothetical protein